jgi:NAD(P)-dependent dehydrogenase (short-subunit alcohol dehydrogenase family)
VVAPTRDGKADRPLLDLGAIARGDRRLLAGNVVIMTGAGGGIGARIAEILSLAGARLALTDVDAATLTKATRSVVAGGGECLGEPFDSTDQESFSRFHDRVLAELGPVDGLINCAGWWSPAPFEGADPGLLERALATNLHTAWCGCRAVFPGMVARRSGAIVNFASTAGEYGSHTPAAHYAAAKGGVIGLTKSLAREAGPYQVRVNALSPGPTATPALGASTAEQVASVSARTLFNRLGTPDEIAGGCLYLLSPLSTFVTGTVLQINGGSLL